MLMRLLRPLPALAGAAIMFVTRCQCRRKADSLPTRQRHCPCNISTTTIVNDGPSADAIPPGSPFEEFFRNFGDDNRQRHAASLGSGLSSMMPALWSQISM